MSTIPEPIDERAGAAEGTLAHGGTVAGLLLFAAVIVRVIATTAYRIDSDEPQHLHVAWGWTKGFVQYRDLFDNHLPLFHLLTAPYVALFDNDPQILLYARLLMLPLFFALLALTYGIGCAVATPRAALWGVVFLAMFPPSLLKSIEFRNDNLCVVLTLAAFAILVRRGTATSGVFFSGLALGAAFAASLKTAVFLAALAMAATLLIYLRREMRPALREGARIVFTFAAGFAIVPLAILALFASLGAVREMVFAAYTYNSLFEPGLARRIGGAVAFPLGVAVILRYARRSEARAGLLFTSLVAAIFIVTLLSFWPLITTRDFLPVFPLLAIVLGAFAVRDVSGDRLSAATAAAVFALVATFFSGKLDTEPPADFRGIVRDAVALTKPGEPLLDLKGETIFRPRPSTYILEVVGRSLIANGTLPDTFARDYLGSGCRVVSADLPKFPDASRRFFERHTVPAGSLRVAGAHVDPSSGAFDIAVADAYAFATPAGVVGGILDGTPTDGVATLARGQHTFHAFQGEGEVLAVWDRAVKLGYYRDVKAAAKR